MAPYEDVLVQLVDTPPVTADHVPPGMPGLWRAADALLIVADLSGDEVLDGVETCLDLLGQRHIALTDGPRALPDDAEPNLRLPGFVLANKSDAAGADENLEMLRELVGGRLRIEATSAHDPGQLARLPEILFKLIRVIRVYAKPPGKKPDMEDPFVLPGGSDIHALARRVYHGSDHRTRSARIWGHGVTDGQNVHLDHVLHDKDIVELHA
jgi:ribosome-interacting GTPase 1